MSRGARRWMVCGLGVWCAATTVPAQALEITPPLETRITQALQQPVRAEWTDVELWKVVEQLASATKVPWSNTLWSSEEFAEEKKPTDPSKPVVLYAVTHKGDPRSSVSLHLGEITVAQALRFVLKPARLGIVCRDHDIRVTTFEETEIALSTHIYDVSVLVQALQGKVLPSIHANTPPNRGSGAGGFGQFGSGFGGMTPDCINDTVYGLTFSRSKPIPSVETALVALLQATTSGEWEDIDGTGGSIVIGRGRLMVRQTQRTHWEIAGLLRMLEQIVTGQTTEKTVPVPSRFGYPAADVARIATALKSPCNENLLAVPLRDAIARLCVPHKIPIWIDEVALLECRFDSTKPVSVVGAGRPLQTLLHDLLEHENLNTVIDEGCLVLTIADETDLMLDRGVYRVGDIPEATNAKEFGDLFTSVTSGEWEHIDGTGGTFVPLTRDILVVRQTQRVHAELAALFDGLRRPAEVESTFPEPDAAIEVRLYAIPDAAMVPQIEQLLPTLFGGADAWPPTSLVRLGDHALVIHQPRARHAELDVFFGVLEKLHQRLHPVVTPAPNTTKAAAK
jgi:hypothetical protein